MWNNYKGFHPMERIFYTKKRPNDKSSTPDKMKLQACSGITDSKSVNQSNIRRTIMVAKGKP